VPVCVRAHCAPMAAAPATQFSDGAVICASRSTGVRRARITGRNDHCPRGRRPYGSAGTLNSRAEDTWNGGEATLWNAASGRGAVGRRECHHEGPGIVLWATYSRT
jgi:hypothetical protein